MISAWPLTNDAMVCLHNLKQAHGRARVDNFKSIVTQKRIEEMKIL